jgi:hypothetical protein
MEDCWATSAEANDLPRTINTQRQRDVKCRQDRSGSTEFALLLLLGPPSCVREVMSGVFQCVLCLCVPFVLRRVLLLARSCHSAARGAARSCCWCSSGSGDGADARTTNARRSTHSSTRVHALTRWTLPTRAAATVCVRAAARSGEVESRTGCTSHKQTALAASSCYYSEGFELVNDAW